MGEMSNQLNSSSIAFPCTAAAGLSTKLLLESLTRYLPRYEKTTFRLVWVTYAKGIHIHVFLHTYMSAHKNLTFKFFCLP